MPDLAAMQKLIDSMFPGLMGVRLTEVTVERVVAEMEVRPDLCTAGEHSTAAPTWRLPTRLARWARW